MATEEIVSQPEAELPVVSDDSAKNNLTVDTSSEPLNPPLLNTPSPSANSDGFDDESNFYTHTFYGPSSDNPNVRTLHGVRKIDPKGPKFSSESSQIIIPDNSVFSRESIDGSLFEVKFTEEKLGLCTEVRHMEDGCIKVYVAGVDQASPAKRAGVSSGDCLISVNDRAIESNMTEEQVLDIMKSATIPRTLLFLRLRNRPLDQDAPRLSIDRRVSTNVIHGLKTAKKFMGSALSKLNPSVHEDSFCDGCGANPIKGVLWSCSQCSDYTLCNSCYEQGVHGFEDGDSVRELNDAIVQDKLRKRCKQFTSEFLQTLKDDVCKGRTDKFEYMGSWLADIVGGTNPSRITVRGIEIPYLSMDVRQKFVGLLMPLASNRNDLEVHIEWLPQESHETGSDNEEESKSLEKLRIWISDKKSRTKSPFA